MIVYEGPVDSGTELVQFFRRHVSSLRSLRRVVITPAGATVYDVNKDGISFPGLTYGNPVLEDLMRELHVIFVPQQLHDATLTPRGVKEYELSARHPWGEDRVMG
jgi:hypothetical protein